MPMPSEERTGDGPAIDPRSIDAPQAACSPHGQPLSSQPSSLSARDSITATPSPQHPADPVQTSPAAIKYDDNEDATAPACTVSPMAEDPAASSCIVDGSNVNIVATACISQPSLPPFGGSELFRQEPRACMATLRVLGIQAYDISSEHERPQPWGSDGVDSGIEMPTQGYLGNPLLGLQPCEPSACTSLCSSAGEGAAQSPHAPAVAAAPSSPPSGAVAVAAAPPPPAPPPPAPQRPGTPSGSPPGSARLFGSAGRRAHLSAAQQDPGSPLPHPTTHPTTRLVHPIAAPLQLEQQLLHTDVDQQRRRIAVRGAFGADVASGLIREGSIQKRHHHHQEQQQSLQEQQQEFQQQAAAATAAAAAAAGGLPLLAAVSSVTMSYNPWGPVLPTAIHMPPAALLQVPEGLAMSPCPTNAAAGGLSPMSPSAAAAAAAAAVAVHSDGGCSSEPRAGAVLQLAAAAAAVAAAAAAAPMVPLPFLVTQPPAVAAAMAGDPGGQQLQPMLQRAAVTAVVSQPTAAEQEALASHCRLAAVLRQAGKAAEALTLLESVLLRHPTSVEALHLRAQCQQALGQVQEAMSTHLRVLSLVPDHTPSLTALGGLYQSQGLLGEAVAAYRRAHELRPEDASIREGLALVLTDQGTKLKNAGASVAEAVSRYQAAAALCPSYAPALYNLGVVAGELRQTDAAIEYYRAALAAEPRYAQAHCNLGVLLRERGRLVEAVASYEAALAAAPNFVIVRNNLAIALTDLGTHVKNEGRLDEGIKLYERALSYAPRHADALYNLGVAYGEKGDLQRAAFMYEMALAFNPTCAEAHNNLGVIWKEQDNIDRAVECYSAALAIRPNFPQSLNNLGVVMTAQGRAAEALALLAAAVAASPTYTEAHNNLGVLQRDVGCIPDALASYTRCLELDPDCRNAGQNRLLALNYIHPGEEELVSAAHREWGERFQASIRPLPPLGPTDRSWDPGRALRIGYISPDLFTHSVSYFAEAPLTHHSPQRGYQHVIYSCVPKPDAKTARLKAATEAAGGVWRDVLRLSEAELADLVRQDEIDLLVELTGHTANNRLGVMARRPAPVQLTWIGYPNSTGLRAVDYRLTDDICDPWDTKQTFVEELVRLPGCFLCYTPAPDAPPVGPLPALANGYITFGSFNNLAKITPQVLRLWGAILAAVPRSRLVLKNKPFACEAARTHVMRQLAAVGVEPWRVDLLPLAPGNVQHLATYSLMDISLDPFPYAGTTTTTESLYMGVPCLTLASRCHAHNVSVSLLTAVGLHPPPGRMAPAPALASPSSSMGTQAQAQAWQAASGAIRTAAATGTAASASDPMAQDGASAPLASVGATAMPARCEGSGDAAGGGDRGYSAAGPAATAGGACGGGCDARPARGWVACSEEEYVELAVAHASDVQALVELRSSLRERMLSSPMCDGPAFMRRLEDVYRALWRRHCANVLGDEAAAAAAAAAAGLVPPGERLGSAAVSNP